MGETVGIIPPLIFKNLHLLVFLGCQLLQLQGWDIRSKNKTHQGTHHYGFPQVLRSLADLFSFILNESYYIF